LINNLLFSQSYIDPIKGSAPFGGLLMAAKFKKETTKNVQFAKGGTTPMFGSGDRTTTASSEQAGQQAPGGTAHKSGANSGGKYAEGGKTKMYAYSPSVPATAGQTGAR
jgi:hypothetical protein